MNNTTIDNYITQIIELLNRYDPYDVYYLDQEGNWQKEPKTITEIISSEIWFRLWEAYQRPDYENQVSSLIEPIITNEKSEALIKKLAGTAHITTNVDSLFLKIFELLYLLVEYHFYLMNTRIHIPDWNYKEKRRQKEYQNKKEEFISKLNEKFKSQELLMTFFTIYEQMLNKKNGIFERVCSIIFDEERINKQLERFEDIFIENKKIDELYTVLGTQIDFDLESIASTAQALLRPLLNLLNTTHFEISSGLHYNIISLLGGLNDPRSTKTLLNLLHKTEPSYVNLVGNIIYALGNIGYKNLPENLKRILQLPDYIKPPKMEHRQPITEIKIEAIWAIGKCGINAKDEIDDLAELRNHRDNKIKIHLAWALGMIGAAQKNESGGIDVKIITTLLDLLNEPDKKLFEETIYNIKKLGFYEIIDSLNLKYIPKTPILALKPSSIGLYELSETILHLIGIKHSVVLAVTGDSGTGKTYFCETIKNGFGNIAKEEILYLMRDNPGDRALFSKMLDPKYVREYIERQYANTGFQIEVGLSGSEFLHNFIQKNANKKLIILDGWLDDTYFYQVLKVFYRCGFLDCIVNFRATYSTRRINLETRERILERVKDCLRFVENPAIEDTEFYRNGDVFVYNLDNSISSRLSREEIKEIFSRKKIGVWGEHIRIGRFEKGLRKATIIKENLLPEIKNIEIKPTQPFNMVTAEINIKTTHFSRLINEETSEQNLIQTIDIKNMQPKNIVYHSPGIIAYYDDSGIAGILTGINNQNSFTSLNDRLYNLCICDNMLCLAGQSEKMYLIDFDKKESMTIETYTPGISCLTSDRSSIIVTGHTDGSIRIWDIKKKMITQLCGHIGAVTSLIVLKNNNVISLGSDSELRLWNFQLGNVRIYKFKNPMKWFISSYISPDDCIFIDSDWGTIKTYILNLQDNTVKKIITNEAGLAQSCCASIDGKIFIGYQNSTKKGMLIVIQPQDNDYYYKIIGKHGKAIAGCITMGPQIITLGIDGGETNLKIWASDKYAEETKEKLRILKGVRKPFQYYSLIF